MLSTGGICQQVPIGKVAAHLGPEKHLTKGMSRCEIPSDPHTVNCPLVLCVG